MQLIVEDIYEEVKWFGRGTQENYPDRILSAHIGRYASSIGDLLIAGDFHFSVSRHSQANLARAKHTNEWVAEQALYVFRWFSYGCWWRRLLVAKCAKGVFTR